MLPMATVRLDHLSTRALRCPPAWDHPRDGPHFHIEGPSDLAGSVEAYRSPAELSPTDRIGGDTGPLGKLDRDKSKAFAQCVYLLRVHAHTHLLSSHSTGGGDHFKNARDRAVASFTLGECALSRPRRYPPIAGAGGPNICLKKVCRREDPRRD